MSRPDGFTVMDVSTDIVNDPKFRRLRRDNPEHLTVAFMVYIAVLGESWRAGRRVPVMDAWPVLLSYDEAVVASMRSAGLLDRRGQLPGKAWDGWYAPARERRDNSRERWRRANEKRAVLSVQNSADTAVIPRGIRAVTASTVPSVPSVPSVRGAHARAPARLDEEEPEGEALTWLARHGCYIAPGNGYHRTLITAVERHGVNALVGMFDRLATAGTLDGDMKGFVFGAIDALDARSRPNLEAVEREEDRAEDAAKREAASARQLAKLREPETAMTEEQRAANLARLHDEMAAKGLV